MDAASSIDKASPHITAVMDSPVDGTDRTSTNQAPGGMKELPERAEPAPTGTGACGRPSLHARFRLGVDPLSHQVPRSPLPPHTRILARPRCVRRPT